ncbi:MAG: glycosyl hydrolase 108 family protein, partial [Candidatus Adiutrix sp.]
MGFDSALIIVLEFEGGYVHDPADRGGETFRGISRKN